MDNKAKKIGAKQGTVISDKMDKTIVVRVVRKVKHPVYKKVMKRSIKFKVHDQKNEAKNGDTVRIVPTRPMSKDKRYRLIEIVEKKV